MDHPPGCQWETSTQDQAGFNTALECEGLLDAALTRAATGRVGPDTDDGLSPILLAVSENGSQMIATDTRRFRALVAIAQHFGRPLPRPTRCPGTPSYVAVGTG